MSNKYMDTAFTDKAIKFAVDAHANTERRGKGTPYVLHVLEAMTIVETMTSDPELLAAAALHDVVEDTEYTEADIEKVFGKRVAALVRADSDEDSDKGALNWKDRKGAAIKRIAASSHDAKIVAMGDKLSNMRAIKRDYEQLGDELWKRFHVSERSMHEWHYRGLAASLSDLSGTDAYREFTEAIDFVFGAEKK